MENSRLLRDYLLSITDGFQVSIDKIEISSKTPTEVIGVYNWNDYHGRYKENVPFQISIMDLLVFSYETVKDNVEDINHNLNNNR